MTRAFCQVTSPTNTSKPGHSTGASLVLLVGFVKIKPGLDILAVPKTPPSFVFGQRLVAGIPPAVLHQEIVPDLDLLRTRPATVLETPLQDFLVGASTQDPFDQGRIFDAQETGASRVEPCPIARAQVVSGREPSGGVQPDLVEHPPEKHDAAHFFVIASQTGNFHDVAGVRLVFRLYFACVRANNARASETMVSRCAGLRKLSA